MAITVTHAFVSAVQDSGNANEVGPDEWNDGHVVTTEVTATGSTASRTLEARFSDIVNLKDFGAIGDGSTDDTAAITAWLAALTTGKAGFVPAGTYKFTSALTKTNNSHFSIAGAGGQESTLLYAGANTTNDIITLGDGVTEVGGVYLSNFRLDSSTTMTGGNGLRLRQIVRSALNNVVIGGQDGNNKLYDGIFFDQADQVTWNGFDVKTLHDGVKIVGGSSGPRANLFMMQGKILQCGRYGLLIGGGFGGLYVDATDIIANASHNVVIDQSLAATGNRELFFGPGCFIDSSVAGSGVHFDNGMAANGYVQFSGTWVSGNAVHGINITSTEVAASRIQVSGGTLFSNVDGIRVSSTGPTVSVYSCKIRNNSGWGVNANVAAHSVEVGPCTFISNSSGNINTTNEPATFSTAWRLLAERIAIDASSYFTMLSTNPIWNLDATDYLIYDRGSNLFTLNIGGNPKIAADDTATATHTALKVYDVDNNALESVTVGAADSGGAGFKLLRVPN